MPSWDCRRFARLRAIFPAVLRASFVGIFAGARCLLRDALKGNSLVDGGTWNLTVLTFLAKRTFLVEFLLSGSTESTGTGSRPARAAVAARDLITTVATRSSLFPFLGRERSLFFFLSCAVSVPSPASPSVPLPEFALGSGVLARLAGEAFRRCA